MTGHIHPETPPDPVEDPAPSDSAARSGGSAEFPRSRADQAASTAAVSELVQSVSVLDTVLKSIHVELLFFDRHLRIRKFTPLIHQALHVTAQDIGKPIDALLDRIDAGFVLDARRVLETLNPAELETRGIRGNWLHIRLLPCMADNGSASGVVAAFSDVTAVRNANEMTRAVNQQLAHANTALSGQREELEEMFSIVAHDLKRPVLALDGLLALIGDDEAARERTPDARTSSAGNGDFVRRARIECKRLRQMLVDLEGIAGIQQRSIVCEPVAAEPWLRELTERFRAAADAKRVRLTCGCTVGAITIARSFLEEVIVNLIENALKYGCTNSSPAIDVVGTISNEMFRVSVTDNGKGIAKENQKKIFEPFRRLEPEVAPGSGIGLLAVKRLLLRLGGHVEVESAPHQGARFVVRVPLPSDAAAVGSQTPGKIRVLLVEDDLIDARRIVRCLKEGYAITNAKSLQEAHECLIRDLYDVVLLDLSLPDGHGLELVNEMRTELNLRTPVVIITGHGDGLVPSIMDTMIGAYVSKAEVTRERLVHVMNEALNSADACRSALG